MADIQASASPSMGARKPRAHRMSTRIDLTPMVDLGFLLITFFMLTTVLNKPSEMPLVMPDKHGETEPVKQSKVLTLLLGSDDKIYWYEGLDLDKIDSTGFDADGLRSVILQKKGKVDALWGLEEFKNPNTGERGKGSRINIIIKPTPGARYKNLVDVLDEMAICQIRYYCVVDPNAAEMLRVKS